MDTPSNNIIDVKKPAVVCQNVVKTYISGNSTVEALKGINLEVMPGELRMLVGPSGCGKTTLISVISGILNHDSGTCLIYGNNLKEKIEIERTEFRGKYIGFVFQSFNLIPMLTAKENVSIPLVMNGMDRLQALEIAEQFLIEVGLGDKLDILPNELSGGQQQRVAIARGCIHDPKLIVCDEPTSALDRETGEKILTLLKEFSLKKDRALIIVTHDARIFHFADRISKMDDGKIVANDIVD